MTVNGYKKFFDLSTLIKQIKSYLPNFDPTNFNKAFEFAENAHKGQMRKDGRTPYIAHPANVVDILTTFHADEEILIAAILHDVPEDTSHDIHEVEALFGKKIAFLVSGITKLSKVHYQHNMGERQVESLKRLFLQSTKDPRMILIKLADRLHNMRTLEHVSPEKQLRIASETLEIYVPMANLLGIQGLKAELEDLCFKHLHNKEFTEMEKAVKGLIKKNEKALSSLLQEVNTAFSKVELTAEVSVRKQSLYTIHKKLSSKGKGIEGLLNIVAIRIVVNNVPHCYEALGIIHGIYLPKISKFKDYIANPKVNKYQSLHTVVFGPKGITVDVQIRTKSMQIDAEYGIASNFFKGNHKIDHDARSSWLNKVLELEKTVGSNGSFLRDLKEDVLQDRIFVYTPKGGTIDLPKEATAIDFAYAIHSSVGNNAVKAEINGDIVSITTPLKTGDVVRIINKKIGHPSLSWLSFVKTNVAKNKIQIYLRKMSPHRKLEEGRKALQKEFDIGDLGLIGNISFKKIRSNVEQTTSIRFDKLKDLLIAVGEGKIKPLQIVKSLQKDNKAKSHEKELIDIKILAKNRFGLLREIYSTFYKYSLDMMYMKAWTSPDLETAQFNVQVLVRDIEHLESIFDELEQIDSILQVYKVPSRVLRRAFWLVGLTLSAWILHPFILQLIWKLNILEKGSFASDILLVAGLFVIFVMVVVISQLMKNHVPYIRNKKLLWVAAFGFPMLAVATLTIDLLYFKVELNWIVIVLELAIIYAYLALSLFNLRKYI